MIGVMKTCMPRSLCAAFPVAFMRYPSDEPHFPLALPGSGRVQATPCEGARVDYGASSSFRTHL